MESYWFPQAGQFIELAEVITRLGAMAAVATAAVATVAVAMAAAVPTVAAVSISR
jgi:hypothetical protein